MNELLQAALDYAARGWRVMPCRNKRPLTNHGSRDATTDEALIAQWWARWPDAQVAVATGPESGIWILDSDNAPLKNRDGHESLRLLEAANGELPECPTVKTPSSGSHYYFAWPADTAIRNTVDELGVGLDTRGTGGYAVCAPSPGYDWEIEPDDEVGIPEAPAWLVERLARRTSTRTVAADLAVDDGLIPDGRRNQTLARIAGVIRAVGCRESEILALIRAVNSNRCVPAIDNDDELRDIAESISRYEPEQAFQAAVECWELDLTPSRTVALTTPTMRPRKHPHPGSLPTEVLNPGGLLQQIIDYTLRTSLYPQPVGALAMALTLMGTITSRKYATQTDLRTNIYTIFICESGGGKEHARKVAKDILMADVNLSPFLGSEGLASDAAICSQLFQHEARLFMLDEIGRVMQSIADTGGRTPAHLANIAKVFMELYSKANQYHVPKAYADSTKSQPILYPAPCIYGTTVAEPLFNALKVQNMTEGLVGRFLFFQADEARPARNDSKSLEEPPPDMVSELARLADLHGVFDKRHPKPLIIPDTPGAAKVIADFRRASEIAADSGVDAAEKAVHNRAAESAYKLALLHALSMQRDCIDADSAEWGCALAHHCIGLILHLAEDMLWENQTDKDRKRVLGVIRAAGESGLTQTALSRAARWLKRKELEEIVQDLQEQELVIIDCADGIGAGRKARVYRAV